MIIRYKRDQIKILSQKLYKWLRIIIIVSKFTFKTIRIYKLINY